VSIPPGFASTKSSTHKICDRFAMKLTAIVSSQCRGGP
jgi:hypothetical protein